MKKPQRYLRHPEMTLLLIKEMSGDLPFIDQEFIDGILKKKTPQGIPEKIVCDKIFERIGLKRESQVDSVAQALLEAGAIVKKAINTMIQEGASYEEIAIKFTISVDQVEQLAEKKPAGGTNHKGKSPKSRKKGKTTENKARKPRS